MICTRCKVDKDITEFIKNRAKPLGRIRWCKDCNKTYWKSWRLRSKEKSKVYQATYVAKNPDARRKYLLNRKYGMSQVDYDLQLKAQEGLCEICSQEETLVVDHNHKTGIVRGLLCNKCNQGLGSFKDNSLVLEKAASYIREHT